MDKIIVRGMNFSGRHGVLPREKVNSQPFIVDVSLYLDLKPAGQSDDLDLTVNYDTVYHLVEKQVEQKSYQLLEALAENIAADLLRYCQVKQVRVKVAKPQAPVEGKFDYFAVEIKRFRE